MDITSQRSELSAVGFVVLSGTLYGLLGFFGTQLIKESLAVPAMLFWRFFIAAMWMLIWNGLQHKRNFLKRGNKKNILPMILCGIFYGCSSLFYFYASKNAGTGLAMVIFFAYPIFVAVIACFQNFSHLNFYSVTSLIVVSIGLFLLKVNDVTPVEISSLVLALIAALSYALYILQSKQMLPKFQPEQFTMIVCFVSALFFLIISISSHNFALPNTFRMWGYMLALSIFVTAIPIQLMLEGMKIISSLKASILSVLEPVVTLMVGVIMLHEILSLTQIVGVVVILIGTFVIQFAR